MLGNLGGVEIIRRRAELGNLSPAVSCEASQDEIVACRIALHRSMYSFLPLRQGGEPGRQSRIPAHGGQQI
jgi:hypothetical protein